MPTDPIQPPPVRGTLEPLAPPGRAAVTRAWREQRIGFIALAALTAVLVVVIFAVGERIAFRSRVLPGVEVAGHDIGGLSEPEARREINTIGAGLSRRTIHARAGEHDLSFDPVTIGYRVDGPATVRAARAAGRSANPLNGLAGTVLRALRQDDIPMVVHHDPNLLAALIDTWVGATGKGLVDGGLRFEGTQVAEIRPRRGIGIDRDDAERRILDALRLGETDIGTIDIGPTTPAIDLAEVRSAARRARSILRRPVTVRAGTATLTLSPEQIASTLRTRISGSRLQVRIDETALRAALGPALVAVETQPTDATFAVNGTQVSVVPAVTGVLVQLRPVSRDIAAGLHAVVAPLRATEPAYTTAWATKLNITELVASYTTNHPCCQPRITNIHQSADAINGTIVEPGATFSLNGALGPRTTEKGYVLAPGIGANLEFEDSVGGGVSQLSTTLYNAAFFGCYEDVTHTVHALFISRYPMGREATLNFPSIDNKFRNDSKSGVLVRASYSGTSITVALYGNQEGRTCRAEGPNILETIPIEREYVDDPALPFGTEKELTPGSTGYVVENFRIITRPGQPDLRERYLERYSMAKAKFARGIGLPVTTTTTTAPPGAPTTTSSTTPLPPPPP